MINEKDLPWYDWAEDSKVRAIKEMAAYLKKETPSEYRITWACLATDMSWAKGIAKAAKGKRLQ